MWRRLGAGWLMLWCEKRAINAAAVGCHTRWVHAGSLRCVEAGYGLLYQLTAAGITVASAGTDECFVASFGLT